jgi:hypothetical protein
MSTQNSSFIARVIRAIVDAFKAQCEGVCERREQIRWLSVR